MAARTFIVAEAITKDSKERTAVVNQLFEFLRLGGTSSGSKEMNIVATASGAKVFSYVALERITIHRLNFTLIDGAIKYGQFLGIASALSNGIKAQHRRASGAILKDFLDGETITKTEHFGWLAGTDAIKEPGAGDDSYPVRWTMAKSGEPMEMEAGTDIAIIIQDDLSTVAEMSCMIQGHTGPSNI